MPVAFQRTDESRGRIPVAVLPFRLGRHPDNELVVTSGRVQPWHARLGLVKGDYLLSAEDHNAVWINEAMVPLMILRDGDRICLTDPAAPTTEHFVFRNRMEGTFVPPAASVVEAWCAYPASSDPSNGPQAWRRGALPVGAEDPSRLWQVEDPERGRLMVRVFPAVRRREAAERFLRLLMALAGLPHPGLPQPLDGGLWRDGAYVRPWMLFRRLPGQDLRAEMEKAPHPYIHVLSVLADAGRALLHLHRRGFAHRHLVPGNVLRVGEDEGAVVGLAMAREIDGPPSPGQSVVGEEGFLAPEVVLGGPVTPRSDVYGLAAITYGLLTGRAPFSGPIEAERLTDFERSPVVLHDLEIRVPTVLETFILSALRPLPQRRPPLTHAVAVLESYKEEIYQ